VAGSFSRLADRQNPSAPRHHGPSRPRGSERDRGSPKGPGGPIGGRRSREPGPGASFIIIPRILKVQAEFLVPADILKSRRILKAQADPGGRPPPDPLSRGAGPPAPSGGSSPKGRRVRGVFDRGAWFFDRTGPVFDRRAGVFRPCRDGLSRRGRGFSTGSVRFSTKGPEFLTAPSPFSTAGRGFSTGKGWL
jgi:hypothetical protein